MTGTAAINAPASRFLARQGSWSAIHSSKSPSSTLPPSSPSSRTLYYLPTAAFPPVKLLRPDDRKRILVTGGAGFVGSHLVDRLMLMGHDVTVLDNYFSGSKTAVSHWVGHPNFEMVRHDVTEPFLIEVDQIYHLACPASPQAYQYKCALFLTCFCVACVCKVMMLMC